MKKKQNEEATQASGVAVGKVYDYPKNKVGVKVSMLDDLLVDVSYPKKKKKGKK
jgi:hypothetical protein